jgi:histidine triad (HIT) family protein
MNTDSNCIFCKIVAGQVPSKKAHEDADTLAFHDIRQAAPVHLLIIPKAHLPSLADATDADQPMLGKLLRLAPELARQHGLHNGFKTVVHTGKGGGQEVFHLHLHVMGTPGAADA